MLNFTIIYIPFLSLVITGSLGSLGLLKPPLLTAITRNVYFIFSARSCTLPSHLFPINSAAFCHLELKIVKIVSETPNIKMTTCVIQIVSLIQYTLIVKVNDKIGIKTYINFYQLHQYM